MHTATTPSDALLTVRNATLHFPARGTGMRRAFVHALDDVSIEIERAGTLALVGESGSGKSSLARLISLIYRPTRGSILFDGLLVVANKREQIRRYRKRVQMIFQDPFGSMNPVHRVSYPIDRALKIHQHLRGAALVEKRREILRDVELTPAEDIEYKYPHELSGGQRQRINIATALAADPDLLIADEPVSMLDVSIRAGVLRLLARLRDERDVAILFVTHDLPSAAFLTENTAVLYAGQVMEQGPTVDVLEAPLHPYTQLLIASAPDPERRGVRAVARGEAPSAVDPPAGCRFASRCPIAADVCRRTTPELTHPLPGRTVRCHARDPEKSHLFPSDTKDTTR